LRLENCSDHPAVRPILVELDRKLAAHTLPGPVHHGTSLGSICHPPARRRREPRNNTSLSRYPVIIPAMNRACPTGVR